ncbi:MAG: metal ABC transporter permease [Terrimicrobiaceae bacterium]|nr:metal ABC transporter permease [Terrimicrobiaceae bacterium]
MNWLLEPFRYEFMQRALVACVLIGFTNGFLGSFVVLRRLALMADALSHSLLPGLALAAIVVGLNPGGLLLGGLMAAVFVALGGHLIASSSRVKEETAIAALYIVAFAVGIAIIKYAGVRVSLDHFLFGNILGVGDSDLWTTYAISCVVLLSLVALQRPLLLALFEASVARTQGVHVSGLLALLIVLIVLAMLSSLQAVGVLLSLGLLILPAATVYLLSDSYSVMAWAGAFLGTAGAVVGLLVSFWANIPSGPAIVLVLGIVFVLAYLFSPRYGVITRRLGKRHLHDESLKRWKER